MPSPRLTVTHASMPAAKQFTGTICSKKSFATFSAIVSNCYYTLASCSSSDLSPVPTFVHEFFLSIPIPVACIYLIFSISSGNHD